MKKEDPRMPVLLELFSGTGSMGRAFKKSKGLPWDIDSVDTDPNAAATITKDVLQFDPAEDMDGDNIAVVWASPPCTFYSQARSREKPNDLQDSDALVKKCWKSQQAGHFLLKILTLAN
jgi:site-specific DNA-cytosine methylase